MQMSEAIKRILWGSGIIVLNLALIFADYCTGPYLPFTLFYLTLIYFTLGRLGTRFAYTVAVLSATGRTLVASSFFPSDVLILATSWQLTTSLAVYVTFCYLLNRQNAGRERAEKKLLDLEHLIEKGSGVGETPPSGTTTNDKARSNHNKRTVALISVVGIASTVCAQQISSNPSTQYIFDQKTGKVAQGPSRGHGSPGDDVAKDKVALLTFDDGPRDPDIDAALLGILKKHAAPSIWFVVCEHFDDVGNPRAAENLQTLQAVTKAGHQIGNHSHRHRNLKSMDGKDPGGVDLEINQCSDAINTAIGARPVYFRAPWGEYSPNVLRLAGVSGMRVMNWTSNSNDASFSGRTEEYRKYLFNSPEINFEDTVKNGDVILLHNTTQTVVVLDQLLTNLEKRGFHFVLPS